MGSAAIPALPYSTARPHITTGDAILWKGNGVISRFIRFWTPFIRASLVVRLQEYDNLRERVSLVETLATGLELRLLSKRLAHYDGHAYWFHLESSQEQRIQMIEFALTNCASGIPYDYDSLVKNIFGRVSDDATRYFCSEFVYETWIKAGLVSAHPSGSAPRPGDIPKWVRGVLTELRPDCHEEPR